MQGFRVEGLGFKDWRISGLEALDVELAPSKFGCRLFWV